VPQDSSVSATMEQEQPSLPLAFKERIEQMNGFDVNLVIQKELTMNDVKGENNRFSMPIDKMIEESIFLTPLERLSLNIHVFMLDHNLRIWDDMYLKKWKLGKSEVYKVYNITGGWYKLVVQNDLKESQKIQLWSFRSNNNRLNFALVKL
jgi:hypothetical protein